MKIRNQIHYFPMTDTILDRSSRDRLVNSRRLTEKSDKSDRSALLFFLHSSPSSRTILSLMWREPSVDECKKVRSRSFVYERERVSLNSHYFTVTDTIVDRLIRFFHKDSDLIACSLHLLIKVEPYKFPGPLLRRAH